MQYAKKKKKQIKCPEDAKMLVLTQTWLYPRQDFDSSIYLWMWLYLESVNVYLQYTGYLWVWASLSVPSATTDLGVGILFWDLAKR